MIDKVRHFGVSRGLKFESNVEGVALAGGLGSRVNAVPSQGRKCWFTAEVYTERGNVGHRTVPVAFSETRFQVKKSACFWRHGRYHE